MSRSRFNRASSVVLAVVMATTAAACVKQDEPGVGITKLQARLAFGVKEVKQETPQPSAVYAEADEDDLVEFLTPPARKLPPLRPSDEEPPSDCPEPGADKPGTERIPDTKITHPPQEGVYRWQAVVNEYPNGEEPKSTKFYVQKLVRRYQEIDETRFRFETVEPIGNEQYLVTTWEVEKAALKVDNNTTDAAVQLPTAGEPERGVVIKKRVVIDGAGQQVPGVRTFEPASGVLVLPIPVTSNEAYQTAAVDGSSGDTEYRDVSIKALSRINACGDFVDGWEGVATISMARTDGTSYSGISQYIVAPQYGGLTIFQKDTFTRDSDQVPVDVYMTLAQLHPDPLPEALK